MSEETEVEQREALRLKMLAEQIANLGEAPESSDVELIGLHQTMHTAWICSDMVGRHLLESETILRDPESFRLANAASDILAELYQRLGRQIEVSRVGADG